MGEIKTLKAYAKEAKIRLKNNFWQEHNKMVADSVEKAQADGVNVSNVTKYYQVKAVETVKGIDSSDEEFYNKVKHILSELGEVSDVLGRLTDKDYYSGLSYEQKQRYNLDLSSKYVKAKDRYYRELKIGVIK